MLCRMSVIGVTLVLVGCMTEDNSNLPYWAELETSTPDTDAEKPHGDELKEAARRKEKAVADLEALGGNYRHHNDFLNLAGSTVQDEDLAMLRSIPLIEKIKLDKTAITDQGLDHLAGLTMLRSVSLRDTGITDEGLKKLKNIPKLREVRLNGTPITDQGLQHLKELSSLQYLGLPLEHLSETAVDELVDALPDLEIYTR